MPPRTAETRNGITVDAGLVDYLDRMHNLGLTPRASCSGLDRDHPEADISTPYLVLQVAPTLRYLPTSLEFPDDRADDEFVERVRAAGERAGWNTKTGKTWIIYPTVKFSLGTPRSTIIHEMFGPDVEYGDLTDDQKDEVSERNTARQHDLSATPDQEFERKWEALTSELERTFADSNLPKYDDQQDFFNEEVEPVIQSIMEYEEHRLINFPVSTADVRGGTD